MQSEGSLYHKKRIAGADIEMKYQAKGIGHGIAEGEIMLSPMPISFLGGVNPHLGEIIDEESNIRGRSFFGKILAFPHGKGSTVGSYVIYQLKKSNVAPAAILNEKADAVVATGAVLAGIPMLHDVPIDMLAEGDRAIVNADKGVLELPEVVEKQVVTVIIRRRERILLLRRSDKVGSFQGRWAGVSGSISDDESPEEAAIRELEEETALTTDAFTFSSHVPTIHARAEQNIWKVHPFLVDIEDAEISLDWEHDKYQWVTVEEIRSYRTVPRLEDVINLLIKAEKASQNRVC